MGTSVRIQVCNNVTYLYWSRGSKRALFGGSTETSILYIPIIGVNFGAIK